MIMIIDTGLGNIASVQSAFSALNVDVVTSSEPEMLEQATRIVLPGVGSFQAGMECLRERGLDQVLRTQIDRLVPLLAICLGMQLLTDGSDEAPQLPGLGIIPGKNVRLPDSVRIPQQGWNRVFPESGRSLVIDGYAAFANSYALPDAHSDWNPAWTNYGHRFVSAVNRDNILACQFHPELSGRYGLDLLRRWLANPVLPGRSSSLNRIENSARSGPRSINDSTVRIIPCLDVMNGRVVKGIRFQNLRDSGDPAERAALYERQGADEIVLLDIAASPGGLKTRLDAVRRVRKRIHIPLTVGGGIRSVEDASRLLYAGADKISVNSAAVRRPELISDLAQAFGRQCVVVAIDARKRLRKINSLVSAKKTCRWEVLINGGRIRAGRGAVEWASEAELRGAGEILLTSWDRDGTRSGADLALVHAVSDAVSVPVVCSGGIGSSDDAFQAIGAGADAILAASIFHDNELAVAELKRQLAAQKIPVRL